VEEPSEDGEVEAAEPVAAEAPELPQAPPEELKGVLATIEQILHEREAQGKPRLRATNLKDLLMARINRFSERSYGFSRFKDLLAVAEKAGVLEINRTGPVHWVTLPHRREEPAPATIEAAIAGPEPAAPVAPVATAPEPEPERDVDLVRFIVDLRDRSRWLTYTYVLTNLISHLAQTEQPGSPEGEARNALNRLVQAGVLKVDREPREIEVGGARHRVRMCHLEESNPLVQSVLASQTRPEAPAAVEPAVEPAAPALTPAAEQPQPVEPTPEPAPAATPATPEPEAAQPAASIAPVAPVSPVALVAESYGLPPLPDSLLMPTGTIAVIATEPVAPPSPPAPVEPVAEAAPAPVAPTAPSGIEAPAEAPAEQGSRPPTLADAFTALREVVRQATGPGKPMAGAASVKTRLGRNLGAFDERTFGFSKFKDFLLAAQREGYVQVESVGPATRVALPREGQG
jgi:hypothetical protein